MITIKDYILVISINGISVLKIPLPILIPLIIIIPFIPLLIPLLTMIIPIGNELHFPITIARLSGLQLPASRLLELAVASTKSSSLAPVVGAVAPRLDHGGGTRQGEMPRLWTLKE
jgi:hypothetical protein